MKNVILAGLPAALQMRLPPGLSGDASALAEALAQRQIQPVRPETPSRTTNLSRRTFIRSALAATAAAALVGKQARACPATQADIEGPYYRAGAPFRQVVYDDQFIVKPFFLYGYILNTNCKPLPGALVDFWQADDAGNYDNTSSAYQGRGRQFADVDGSYWLYTTWPGYYPGRPWHIHVRVSQSGYTTLTSQLYYRDDPLQHPPALELDWFKLGTGGLSRILYAANFNIVLALA